MSIKKTLEPTGDLCIKFTDEEMKTLNIHEGDKFSWKEHEDGILLQKYTTIDIDISEWSRDVLEMVIKDSCEKDISVNEVICEYLEKKLNLLD